jgi:signal transduction histidine kinase
VKPKFGAKNLIVVFGALLIIGAGHGNGFADRTWMRMETNVMPNATVMDASGQFPPSVTSSLPPSRQDQQQLQHFERLASLGTLTGSVAHEIKNALVGVKTFVDLLAREHQDCELAELAQAEIARIQSLVSEILQCAAKPKRALDAVHVNDVLRDTIQLLQEPLRAKRIQLEIAFTARRNIVSGSIDELKQAFLNLLMNAIEASEPEGTIRVRTRLRDGDILSVSIQDFGAGIRPEHLRRLFEPFFTSKPEGTGLGLSITQRIIQEHQGRIDVASMPNEGTTVTLQLPLLEQD